MRNDKKMMLMMLGFVGLECVKGKAADAHDAGVVGLGCVRARQLMLMMLGLLGWTA